MPDNLIDKLIALPSAIAKKFSPRQDIESRVERYTDLSGVSTKELDTGLWYKQHTKIFFLIVVWALAVTAAVLWSYSLYVLGDYLIVGLKQEKANAEALSQSVDVVRYNYDANFQVLQAQALPLGNNHYDLIGALQNKNTNVWGSFSYYFLVDDKKIGEGTGFILPNEQKFVVSLNQAIDLPPSKVQVAVEYFSWRRLNLHNIPDYEQYKNNRIDFLVQDKIFTPANQSGLTGNLPVNQLSFSITNQTSFTYNQAPFLIILYSNQNIAGVNRYIFSDWQSRQKSPVNLTIIGQLPNITDIAIVPDINILDDSNFGQSQ